MSDTPTIFEQQPDADTVGGRLSRARDVAGLSTKELAWRLCVQRATVRAWESDRSEPGSHRIANLAGLLNVSISWILHGVGAGPVDASPDVGVEAAETHLRRLKRIHAETGRLITRMEGSLERVEAHWSMADPA